MKSRNGAALQDGRFTDVHRISTLQGVSQEGKSRGAMSGGNNGLLKSIETPLIALRFPSIAFRGNFVIGPS